MKKMTTNKQLDVPAQQNPASTSPTPANVATTALPNALHNWLVDKLGSDDFVVQSAFPAINAPKYFRITIANETRVLIDASLVAANYCAYSKVSSLMRAAQVNAPEVLAEDTTQGFYLLSDMGYDTYSESLNETNADSFFRDARATLIKWQLASRPDTLSNCDAAFLNRELAQFSNGYIAKRSGIALTPDQQQILASIFKVIVEANLAQANVYVHRDFVPGNLVVAQPNPGAPNVLGFQGAMFGAISYDISSLYKDVAVLCDEERILDGTIRYWESAKKANLPVPADFGDFYRDAEWMGLQRHLKLMGTLTQIGEQAEDIPRLIRYVRQVGERYVALFPLIRLFDKLNINDGIPRTVGISF
jgi:N-acetylmuramate 1-kinase